MLGLVSGVVLVGAVRIRAHDNGGRLPSLAFALVASRAPESSISPLPTLSFDGTHTRLLLGLFGPSLVVTEDLALNISPAPLPPPGSILVVRILVLLNDAAQSRTSRGSRSANLLRSRVEELLRRRRAADSTPDLPIPPTILLLLSLRLRAPARVVARSLSTHRRRHALGTRRLARNRAFKRWHVHVLLRRLASRRRRTGVRLRALGRVRAAHAGGGTRRLVMLRAVVLVAVAAFRPDPCCQAADCDRADGDKGHPVAESALLAAGGRGRVEWAPGALLSSVGGHVCVHGGRI